MKQLPFAAKNAVASGAGDAFLCDGKHGGRREGLVEIDTAKMQLKGLHNAYNAMAAALATLADRRRAGLDPPLDLRLRPRLPPPRTRPGSQRRTVDQRFQGHQCRLGILCARKHDTPRGMDRRGHGQRQRLRTAEGFRPCEGTYARLHGRGQHQADRRVHGCGARSVSTGSLDAAMEAANAAQPGDAVLFSPACASFDLFKNYENRGELFKAWVNEKA